MKWLGWLVMVAALVMYTGCGGSSNAKTSSKKTSKTQKARETVEREAPKPPPPKPKLVVPQDAYADVPQAFQSYINALKSQNAKEVDRVEAWLEMNAATSVPKLGEMLKNPSTDLESQIAASRALGRCGPPAAKTLIEAIGATKVDQVRAKSIESLSILKPAPPESIKALHGLMSHQDVKIRQYAIQGLGRIGKPAAELMPNMVPDLMNVLNNTKENETVRSAAKDALTKVDPRKGFHSMKVNQ